MFGVNIMKSAVLNQCAVLICTALDLHWHGVRHGGVRHGASVWHDGGGRKTEAHGASAQG